MAHYGEMLDVYEPGVEKIYQDIDEYFNHPMMVKIKDVDNYSMYMCKTYCLLSNKCRYLIAFVDRNGAQLLSPEKLSEMKWINFQTRTLEDQYQVPSHGYQPKMLGPLKALITRVSHDVKSSVYSCNDYPIKVTMLNDENKEEYKERGNIIAALETYSTIINIVNT
jgi:hypothetical protein